MLATSILPNIKKKQVLVLEHLNDKTLLHVNPVKYLYFNLLTAKSYN